eukprot:858504_1
MSLILSSQRLDCLIVGYCRTHSDYVTAPLSELCSTFYTTTHYLTFKDIANSISSHTEAQTITLDDYTFNISMLLEPYTLSQVPNDITIDPCIIVSSAATNIKRIVISYHLVCTENNAQWKGSQETEFDKDLAIGNVDTLKASDISHFNTLESLEFAIDIKILSVFSKTKHFDYDPPDVPWLDGTNWVDNSALKLSKMPRNIHFEWTIDADTLNMLRQCNHSKYIYSENFGNNAFCLTLTPRGSHPHNQNKAFINLKMLNLPFRVFMISATTKITSKCMDKAIDQYDMTFSFIGSSHSRKVCLNQQLFEESSLTLSVEMSIRELWVFPGNRAHPSDWACYGVVDDNDHEATKQQQFIN